MTPPQINRIARLELITADAGRAARFYCGLGFQASGALGAAIRLHLGEQEIALVELPEAAPYPTPRAANDAWFQHFAIAVSDIDMAAALALSLGATPISMGGPQRLPPNTGSVTAWKFRDPEGHALEFSYLPGSPWLDVSAPGPCLGIDHTAIGAGDLTTMLGFYEAMGLRETGRSLNRGVEQDRLDGLHGVAVDIVALAPPGGGLHLELLHYRSPVAEPSRPTDGIAATRTVVTTDAPSSIWRDPGGHILDSHV